MARFALEAVANRVRCLLWHEEGFPGAWAPFLSPRPKDQMVPLDRSEKVWQLWNLALGHQDDPAVARMLDRSYMKNPDVAHVFSLLAGVGFQEVPPAARDMLQMAFAMGQTKLIEDTFQRGRTAETQHPGSNHMSMCTKYRTAVQSKVLDTVHRFEAA